MPFSKLRVREINDIGMEGRMGELTHIDEKGNAAMVDVTDKDVTVRTATAGGRICMSRETFLTITGNGENMVSSPKGDVLGTARIAGIMAAKRTSELIPLCHPLQLTGITVEFETDPSDHCIRCACSVRLSGRTGAEMEALTGVSVALLTIYDMCKAIDRGMEITDICLMEKSGGKSGHYRRKEE